MKKLLTPINIFSTCRPKLSGFAGLFLLVICLLPIGELTAQMSTGVIWNPPAEEVEADRQLQQFSELGISTIILRDTLSPPLWNRADSLQMKVLALLPVTFPVAGTFSKPDSTFSAELRTLVSHYSKHPPVRALGLFTHGPVSNKRFVQSLEPFVQQIRGQTEWKLFYLDCQAKKNHADRLFDFKLLSVRNPHQDLPDSTAKSTHKPVGGYLYHPRGDTDSLLTPVKIMLEVSRQDSARVFFESDWLLDMSRAHPEFESSLAYFNRRGSVVFPLPEEHRPSRSKGTFIVLILLAIWGIWILNVKLHPVYKKAFSRYFISHNFFVHDIMHRHIRSTAAAVVVLLQHLLATIIAAYCLADILFSEVGAEALLYHYPGLSLFGTTPLISLSLWAGFVSLLLGCLAILWVKVLHTDIKHFSQPIQLFVWPLHLNLLAATLMVPLYISGSHPNLLTFLGGFFAIVLLSTFFVTSLDTSTYHSGKKGLFLFGTVGLYAAMLAGFAFWIFSQKHFLEVVNLAFALG